MMSLKLSAGSMVYSDSKKQTRGVEITQILCENLAKELQNFRNFGAPCAGRIACTRPAFAAKKYRNVAAALNEVEGLFRFENMRVQRRDSAKSAQIFHERICKFSGISPLFRRATHTEFVFLGQYALRKPYAVTEALDRVHHLFKSEKAGARRRKYAILILCENPAQQLQNFRNHFRLALRIKNCM